MTDREVMQLALEALDNPMGIDQRFDVAQRSWADDLNAAPPQLEQQAEPSQWRDMIVVSLVREGINKHRARELAEHFATQQQAEPMTEVADRFAHRMALELECVLSDGAYSNKWYKSAMQVLGEYRSAMNAIHEQHSPTFMGEPKI